MGGAEKIKMQEMGRGAKILTGMLITLIVFTGIYETVFHTVPDGLVLRVWYQKIVFVLIMVWQIFLVVLTVWISAKVFGVVESKAARYIGRFGVWISSIFLVLFLGLVWIIKLFGMETEYGNDNGTITVAHSDFWEETEYSLWEKESFLYRRYLRQSAGRNDINPDQTMKQFLREKYPQQYDDQDNRQTKPAEGYASAPEEAVAPVDSQYTANKQNDGLVAIYEVLSDAKINSENEYRFETSFSSHGEPQAVVYEDGQVVRFLRYDRVSGNGSCYLYVYYESVKKEDGSYSPTDARILDMYAYVVATGQVVLSGKKAWSDLGNAEYREVTGE